MTKINNNQQRIFTFTTSMFWFSLYAYVAELSTYAATLGATYRLVGIITGSYGLTQLILRIPLGIMSDKLQKRKLFIQLGLLVSLISSVITFILPSAFSLLITRALAGVSASTWVLYTVMFSSYFKPEESPRAVGIMNSYNAIGQLTSMAFAVLVVYFLGTRYLFLLAACGACVGFASSLFIHEEKTNRKPIPLSAFISVAKHKPLQHISVLGVLSQLITFATAFGFVPILAKRLGANSVQLILLTAFAIIPAIFVSRLAGSFFPERIGKKNTILIGFFFSSLFCLIMPFINHLWLLYIAQIASGVSRSMVFPLLMGLCIHDIEQEKRATAMGIFQSTYGLGMVLGPVILGFVAQTFGLTVGFMVTSIAGILGLLITCFSIKR